MTAQYQSDELVPINAVGIALPVTASQLLPSGTSGIIFAGVGSDEKVAYATFSGDALKVAQTELDVNEIDVSFEMISGSSYFMMIDLNNVSSSYKHNASLSGIRLSSVQGSCEKTHAQEKWKLHLGVVQTTSLTGSLVNWISVGYHSLSDTFRFFNSIDGSQKNSVDLTVVTGTLVSLSSNNSQFVSDVKSDTQMNDIAGNIVFPQSGDLLLRVNKTGEYGGSLSCRYHVWYLA